MLDGYFFIERFEQRLIKLAARNPSQAFSALKQSYHKAHDVLFLPLIWKTGGDVACWGKTICYELKASAETFLNVSGVHFFNSMEKLMLSSF
jgi:hypothetical protein